MNFLEKVRNCNVLIIGDVMIDTYLNGRVARISPEAPVPVVEFQSRVERLGGAANVALNVKALDAIPILLSVVGKDENAELFSQLLQNECIDNKYIIQLESRQTTIKTRIMSGNQQLLRIDKEDTRDISEAECEKVMNYFKHILETYKVDVIILQDYNKGMLTSNLIQRIVEEAKNCNIPVAVDPKKKNFFNYKDVSLFKPNFKEISEAMNERPMTNIEDLMRLTLKLKEQMPHDNTMITLSDKGIFTFDGKNASIMPTTARDIADVCGAGDSVIAVAALGLAVGESIEEIARISNIAGGQVCEEIGVVPVNKEKLISEI
ncbi:MAG: bifunctional heptose 7-phosphate kinase/heptose 1-phosphate adenyltransferase [Saprospiraceae bacterium]